MDIKAHLESEIINRVLGHTPKPKVDLWEVSAYIGVEIRATDLPDGYTDFRLPRPAIYLNRHDASLRMRQVFAHELAHVILRSPRAQSVIRLRRNASDFASEERLADRIASTLLLPDYWIDTLRRANWTLTGLEGAARIAGVTLPYLVSRMAGQRIGIGMLHWSRGHRSWYVVDRPGVSPSLHGNLQPDDHAFQTLDCLSTDEKGISVAASIDGRSILIEGFGLRRNRDAFQLISSVTSIDDVPQPCLMQSFNGRSASARIIARGFDRSLQTPGARPLGDAVSSGQRMRASRGILDGNWEMK